VRDASEAEADAGEKATVDTGVRAGAVDEDLAAVKVERRLAGCPATDRAPEARSQKAMPSSPEQAAGDQTMRASSTGSSSPSIRTQGATRP